VSPSGAKPINATSSGEETPEHTVGQLGKYGKQWQIAREAFSIIPRSPANNLSASTQGLPVFNNDALKPPSIPAINLRKSAESLKQSLQASASLVGDAFKVDQGAGVREMIFEFYMRQRFILDRVEFEYEMEKECTALQQPQFFISLEHVDYSAREKDRGDLLSSGVGLDDSSSNLERIKPTRDLIHPNINITLPLTGSGKKSNKLVLSTIQMAKTPTRALYFKLRYLFPGVISPLLALSNNLVRLISLRLYGRKYEGESSLQLRTFVLQNQDFHSRMVSSLLATETPPQLRLYLLDFLLSLAPVESIDESEPTMRHTFTEALISKSEEEESVVMQFLRINLLEASNTVADKTHTLVRALLPVGDVALLDAFWQAAIRLLPRASEISSPTGLRCYFDLLLRFFHERFDGVYSEETENNSLPEVLQTSLTLLQTLGQKIFSSMVHRELYPLLSSLCGGDSTQLIFERGLFESFNPRTKLLLAARNKEDLLSKDNEDFSPFDSETPIVTPDNEELDFKFMDSSRGASFDEEKKGRWNYTILLFSTSFTRLTILCYITFCHSYCVCRFARNKVGSFGFWFSVRVYHLASLSSHFKHGSTLCRNMGG
jgi:hypothetical protein